jgi:hypothetical protein
MGGHIFFDPSSRDENHTFRLLSSFLHRRSIPLGILFLGTRVGQFEFSVLHCENRADATNSSNKNETKHSWEAATPRWKI